MEELASNAQWHSLHSMAMDVGNYAKAKQKIIFIDENVMQVNDKNARLLNDQWTLRWHDYLHEYEKGYGTGYA